MKIEKTSLADKLLKSLEEPATEELLSDKLLKMLGDDTKSAKEYYDEDTSGWQMVETKEVEDSDGFMTDYTWYTDNKTKHIFMFGDRDLYSPDEDYADWSIEIDERNPDASFQQAQDWFDNYHGFGSEDYTNEYEDSGTEMDVTHDPLTPVEEGAAVEDTVKQGNHWVNKGKEGTHGKFRTKKAADAQRKAMFANGYAGESEGDKTINVYNPNIDIHNAGQIGKIKNKEDSFATEGVRGQVSNNLSKSVYENFIGNKEVRHDNKKR